MDSKKSGNNLWSSTPQNGHRGFRLPCTVRGSSRRVPNMVKNDWGINLPAHLRQQTQNHIGSVIEQSCIDTAQRGSWWFLFNLLPAQVAVSGDSKGTEAEQKLQLSSFMQSLMKDGIRNIKKGCGQQMTEKIINSECYIRGKIFWWLNTCSLFLWFLLRGV